MNISRLVALAGTLLCSVASALTVNVPTFTDLVAKADVVAKTEVTDVRCEWQTSPTGKQVIVTVVTLKVEDTLKGAAGAQFEFTQLGGQVGSRAMRIDGLPEWHKGDRDILFVAGNGKTVCPLVGIPHGRYWIIKDGDTEYVTRSDGSALAAVAEVATPMATVRPGVVTPRVLQKAAAGEMPMTTDAFAAAIRTELVRIEAAKAAATR